MPTERISIRSSRLNSRLKNASEIGGYFEGFKELGYHHPSDWKHSIKAAKDVPTNHTYDPTGSDWCELHRNFRWKEEEVAEIAWC